MSRHLADIVAIVDMDEFTVTFLCKNRGLRVGDAAALSFLFDIGVL